MVDFYVCPACDDFGPLPMDNVAAHYSAKRDSAHKGGFEKAKILLQEAGPVDNSEVEANDTSDSEDIVFPQNQGGDDPGCPACGDPDYYAAQELLRTGLYGGREKAALQQADRVCVKCGEAY